MRLTIAVKIALAMVAIVIVCIATMAVVTSSNLQRGFIAYLNAMQTQDLDALRDVLAERYRKEGDFEWLRRQPRVLRELLEQIKPQIQTEPDGRARRRPADGPPPRPSDAPAPRSDDPAMARLGYGMRQPARMDGRDEMRARLRDDGADPRGAAPALADPPAGPRDPMGFASRISIVDAQGRPLIGPPDFPPGIERAIVVDGTTVGRVRLLPLRQASGASANAGGFVREQLRDMLWLALGVCLLATLAAAALARHLLRPVAALRSVTEKLARGEFDARAPVLSRDELAELAEHVNAMAQALERSEQQRRTMLADISHELRTPLTVIRGEVEALQDGIRKADTRALASLHAEVLHLNQLVDDLHQLALADAGELHFAWQSVDLGQLLLPLLERYQGRAQAVGLQLRWALPQRPVTLMGDPGRLTQVLSNLLENSLRYTDHGGRIVVTLARQGDQAELVVDDSTPGVPPQQHARIFDRLYRVDQARSRVRGGSGLGLSICKVLVEAHGGSIVALPSVLGGIKMQILLPLDAYRGR